MPLYVNVWKWLRAPRKLNKPACPIWRSQN